MYTCCCRHHQQEEPPPDRRRGLQLYTSSFIWHQVLRPAAAAPHHRVAPAAHGEQPSPTRLVVAAGSLAKPAFPAIGSWRGGLHPKGAESDIVSTAANASFPVPSCSRPGGAGITRHLLRR